MQMHPDLTEAGFCFRLQIPDQDFITGHLIINEIYRLEPELLAQLLKSRDMKASVDSKISEIINDEAGAFFAGQKGAKETADIIQSRVKVYISETK